MGIWRGMGRATGPAMGATRAVFQALKMVLKCAFTPEAGLKERCSEPPMEVRWWWTVVALLEKG